MVYGYQPQQQNVSYGMSPGQQNANLNPAYNPQNFGAIDTAQLKQDAVELSDKASEQVKENWLFKTLRNVFGVKDPKKFVTSLGLTLGTVVGLAAIGNSKFSVHKMSELGITVSDALKKNKAYQSVSNFLKNGKDKIMGFLRKSDTIDDIVNTLKVNKAKPKSDMTRGYGQGFVSIFSLTPVDILKTSLSKLDNQQKIKSLKKLTGSSKKAKEFLNVLEKSVDKNGRQLTNREACKYFTDVISENFGCKNKKDLLNILSQLENGKITGINGKLNLDVSEFTKVVMNGEKAGAQGIIGKIFSVPGKLMSNWWPVNIIDNIGSKVAKAFGKPWKGFARGNLGNSLIKYNAVAGNLADTKIGSLIQKSILVPTESISNFVNDKSGLGVFLCTMIMSLYNNVQDAPKDKKVATVADDFIGTIGSIAISTPMAFGATYGLASLANLEGKTVLSKILKPIGKFFGMGLNPVKNGLPVQQAAGGIGGRVKGFAGGALRFALIMFVFQSLFSKPIKGAIQKVFGKPYVPGEVDPSGVQLPQGMTQEQMLAKIQAHPEFVEKIQNDPKLLEEIQKNPNILLQMVAELPDAPVQQTTQGVSGTGSQSELLQKYINNHKTQAPAQAPMQNPSNAPAQAQNMQLTNDMQPQPLGQNNLQKQLPEQEGGNNTSSGASSEGSAWSGYVPSSKPFSYANTGSALNNNDMQQTPAQASMQNAQTVQQQTQNEPANINLPPIQGQEPVIEDAQITNENVRKAISKADKAMDEAMKLL